MTHILRLFSARWWTRPVTSEISISTPRPGSRSASDLSIKHGHLQWNFLLSQEHKLSGVWCQSIIIYTCIVSKHHIVTLHWKILTAGFWRIPKRIMLRKTRVGFITISTLTEAHQKSLTGTRSGENPVTFNTKCDKSNHGPSVVRWPSPDIGWDCWLANLLSIFHGCANLVASKYDNLLQRGSPFYIWWSCIKLKQWFL